MIKLPIINRIFPSYKSKIIAVVIAGVIVGTPKRKKAENCYILRL